MNNPNVSIIIPCYNAEKYIDDCLNSIFQQSYTDYEIICVNDGSKDKTLEKLKKYNKVKIIDKKNEGAYKARLDGIKKARGKYICVVDCDDIIHKDYLEKLVDSIIANDSDIAICAYRRIDMDTNKVYSTEMNKKKKTINLKDNYGELLEINTSLWNKLYKRELLDDLISFKKSPIAMDDVIVNEIAYLKASKISFVSDILYEYRVRSNSVINSLKSDVINTTKECIIKVRNIYKKKKPEMLMIYDSMTFLHFGVSLLYRIYNSSTSNFRNIYKDNIKFLNDNCVLWKKKNYIGLGYSITHRGSNLKLCIVRFFYRLHLLKLFLGIYTFVINIFKVDLKW